MRRHRGQQVVVARAATRLPLAFVGRRLPPRLLGVGSSRLPTRSPIRARSRFAQLHFAVFTPADKCTYFHTRAPLAHTPPMHPVSRSTSIHTARRNGAHTHIPHLRASHGAVHQRSYETCKCNVEPSRAARPMRFAVWRRARVRALCILGCECQGAACVAHTSSRGCVACVAGWWWRLAAADRPFRPTSAQGARKAFATTTLPRAPRRRRARRGARARARQRGWPHRRKPSPRGS